MEERPEFIPTRRSLLTRLKRWDDQESWRDFFDTYWRLVYSFARQSGLSDSEAQDVVQDTVVSVARKMPSFKYDPVRGSFKAWLMQLSRRRIVDQFRKRPRESEFPGSVPGEETGTGAAERLPDPAGVALEKVWEGEWQKHLLDTALHRVKQRVAPGQYQLFELNVLKEWPVERVAATLNVSANQVYLAKGRVGKILQAELQRIEGELG
jgi:RNA polymerase sigma factor (sigma-70 family)